MIFLKRKGDDRFKKEYHELLQKENRMIDSKECHELLRKENLMIFFQVRPLFQGRNKKILHGLP
jgi:hypothetical protein